MCEETNGRAWDHHTIPDSSNTAAKPTGLQSPDFELAQRFLTLLAEDQQVTFQTFDDTGDKRAALARILHGDLESHGKELARLNSLGAGVFVTVNRTDLQGRTAENVTRVRAVFLDLDGPPLPTSFPLDPHLVVSSHPGNYHVYWLVDDLPREEFRSVQTALAARYDGDNVVDLPRVMRLPGFYHRKGNPVMTTVLKESGGRPFAAAEIFEAFAIAHPEAKCGPSQMADADDLDGIALARLNDWVPKLLPKAKQQRGTDTWRVSSKDLGREFEEDLSIHPKGIRDFGPDPYLDQGVKGKGYTPTGLVEQFQSCTAAEAREWLCEALGLDTATIDDDVPRLGLGTLTQSHNVDRFVAAHDKRVRWTPEAGWLRWDGARWKADSLNAVRHDAELIVRDLLDEAKGINDEDTLKKVLAFVTKSLTANHVDGLLKLAEARPVIADSLVEYDADDWLLNTGSAVVDLRTGNSTKHDSSQRISKVAGGNYDPFATCPQWEAFVHWAMADDPEMVGFLQRLLGSALIGGNRAQRVAFAHGAGANGKTVLFEVVASVLGDYAATASRDQFMRTNNAATKEYGLARLMGVRFLQVAETGEGRRFDEEALKDYSGGDVVSARHPYGRPFEYRPKATIFIRGNHKPRVTGQDIGFWRRMSLIPFEQAVKDEDRDGELAEKLLAERDGILRWLIQGCLGYQRERLGVPEIVRKATAEYRDEEFELGEFVAEACDTGPDLEGAAAALHDAYKRWCEARGDKCMSSTKFGRVLGARFIKQHTRRGAIYEGIRQKAATR